MKYSITRDRTERYSQNLQRQMDNVEQIKQELEHIRSPYSLHEILDLYCKGDYNAELLLQHSLKILIKCIQKETI